MTKQTHVYSGGLCDVNNQSCLLSGPGFLKRGTIDIFKN